MDKMKPSAIECAKTNNSKDVPSCNPLAISKYILSLNFSIPNVEKFKASLNKKIPAGLRASHSALLTIPSNITPPLPIRTFFIFIS